MSRISNFEIELKNIIEEYKRTHEPISLAVSDIATRYRLSVPQVYLYIDQLLHEEDDSHMRFKDQYTKDRFEGK